MQRFVQPPIECIAGTTIRLTWTNTGVTPSIITSALITGSETCISSLAAVASGDGHFFALHSVPTSGGWFINEWRAIIASNTYVDRQLVKSIRLEVD